MRPVLVLRLGLRLSSCRDSCEEEKAKETDQQQVNKLPQLRGMEGWQLSTKRLTPVVWTIPVTMIPALTARSVAIVLQVTEGKEHLIT